MSLTVRDVRVAFDGRDVLSGLSLDVATHETVALLGPSGSGKSTLLSVVAGLLMPDAGSVAIDGRDVTRVPTHRRGVGLVFQDEQLFPHLTVSENVAYGLRVDRTMRRDKNGIDARVRELLHLVGLPDFGDRRVTDLSGGEAKRIALARALAPRPKVLLLDEPLTGLDSDLHDRLMEDVRQILSDTTAIVVTHDRREAGAMAHRVETIHDLQH